MFVLTIDSGHGLKVILKLNVCPIDSGHGLKVILKLNVCPHYRFRPWSKGDTKAECLSSL